MSGYVLIQIFGAYYSPCALAAINNVLIVFSLSTTYCFNLDKSLTELTFIYLLVNLDTRMNGCSSILITTDVSDLWWTLKKFKAYQLYFSHFAYVNMKEVVCSKRKGPSQFTGRSLEVTWYYQFNCHYHVCPPRAKFSWEKEGT